MIDISGRKISENDPPYVIAEISANHNGSLERAKLSIKMAATSGADAVKIQTYNADTMTIDCEDDDFIVSQRVSISSKWYKITRGVKGVLPSKLKISVLPNGVTFFSPLCALM
jgi:N-acetylneuraminate synthase